MTTSASGCASEPFRRYQRLVLGVQTGFASGHPGIGVFEGFAFAWRDGLHTRAGAARVAAGMPGPSSRAEHHRSVCKPRHDHAEPGRSRGCGQATQRMSPARHSSRNEGCPPGTVMHSTPPGHALDRSGLCQCCGLHAASALADHLDTSMMSPPRASHPHFQGLAADNSADSKRLSDATTGRWIRADSGRQKRNRTPSCT